MFHESYLSEGSKLSRSEKTLETENIFSRTRLANKVTSTVEAQFSSLSLRSVNKWNATP